MSAFIYIHLRYNRCLLQLDGSVALRDRRVVEKLCWLWSEGWAHCTALSLLILATGAGLGKLLLGTSGGVIMARMRALMLHLLHLHYAG